MTSSGDTPRARTLAALLLFTGLGALMPGWSLITDPSGAGVGFTPAMLHHGPFRDFLVPGLVLFTVNGLASLVAGAATLARRRWAAPLALALGAALIVWITVQVAVVGPNSYLQPAFFAVGVAELALAWRLERRWRALTPAAR